MRRGARFREQQTKWLQTVHKIAGILLYRRAQIHSFSPANTRANEAVEEVRRKINECGAELDGIFGELVGLERGEYEFGAGALISEVEEIRRPIRISVALLVLARLVPSFGAVVRTVGEVAELIGGEDLAAVLEVRRGQ